MSLRGQPANAVEEITLAPSDAALRAPILEDVEKGLERLKSSTRQITGDVPRKQGKNADSEEVDTRRQANVEGQHDVPSLFTS